MKKNLNYYLSLNYASEISVIPEDEGGGYLACIPLLPGCMTDGETVEEAYTNLQDAKREWIIDMLDRGLPINEVVELLHCGRQKAVNTLRELQYAGLVEIQKQGCGKPNRIYPKSYEAVPNTDFKKSGSGTPEG